jgi:hypothetical protein
MSGAKVERHGRDHRTGGSDPIPPTLPNAIRLWDFGGTQTVTNNSETLVTFANVSSFNKTVFSTVGSPIYSVHFLLAGWYAMFFDFYWTTNFTTGNGKIHVLYTGDTLSGASVNFPNDPAGSGFANKPQFSNTRYFPADSVDALPGAPQIYVAQNSGSTRTLADMYWHIVYLGAGDF